MYEKHIEKIALAQRPAEIIIAEDYTALLDGLAELIELEASQYDITVHKAENGRIALEIMETVTPDLVISDLMMPELGGEDLLKTVRQEDAWLGIPFIFLTAKASPEIRNAGLLMGVDRFVAKPFDYYDLIAMVEVLLTQKFRHDETYQKRMEDARLLAQIRIPHELRTPLTQFVLYFELLESSFDDTDTPEDMAEFLNGSQQGCQRLQTLVNDLVLALETRSGKIREQIKQKAAVTDDWSTRLHDLVTDQRLKISAKNASINKPDAITLTADIAAALPPIYGCSDLLKDAVHRVLDNAIKFTAYQKGGHIDFSAYAEDDQIKIVVADNGIGYPSYLSKEIFGLFYQHERVEQEQQGAGVGLTIAHEVIKAHNGTIEAAGEVGQGATFTITLPAYTGGAYPELACTTMQQKKVTLLAVEDEPILLEGLCDLLHNSRPGGYHIFTATDGVEALKILETQPPPDLIISDIMMPNMDGYELLEQVTKNPAWHEIPFVFLSALDQIEDIQKGSLSHATDYVVKPYMIENLIGLIETRLQQRQAVQEVENSSFEQIYENILGSVEIDLLENLQQVSDKIKSLQSNIERIVVEGDADMAMAKAKQYFQPISRDASRLVYLVTNYTKIIELNGLEPSELEGRFGVVDNPERLINDIVSMDMIRNPNQYEHLDDVCESIEVDCDLGQIPAGCVHDVPLLSQGSMLTLVFSRMMHFVVAHSRRAAVINVDIKARVVDDHCIIALCSNESLLTAEDAAAIQRFIDDGQAQKVAASDLVVAREYADALQSKLRFEYKEGKHCLVYAIPLPDNA